jgi:uncharacterized protein (DUF427 family)
MKTPGPDHPITLQAYDGRVSVRSGGETIAASERAKALHEADYPPVYYIPREDVRMEWLTRSEKMTHCPYKGDAAHFTYDAGERAIENVAWSYEAPFQAVKGIENHIAFYPDKVEITPRPSPVR